jgi:hypothetical protein
MLQVSRIFDRSISLTLQTEIRNHQRMKRLERLEQFGPGSALEF